MILKTRIFTIRNGHGNLSELAQTMGISISQVYRVQSGERKINQKFIIGAINAFPQYRLDELFYLAPDNGDDGFGKEATGKQAKESVSQKNPLLVA